MTILFTLLFRLLVPPHKSLSIDSSVTFMIQCFSCTVLRLIVRRQNEIAFYYLLLYHTIAHQLKIIYIVLSIQAITKKNLEIVTQTHYCTDYSQFYYHKSPPRCGHSNLVRALLNFAKQRAIWTLNAHTTSWLGNIILVFSNCY